MTWQYLKTWDDGGLRTVTVYKNGSEVGTFDNEAHPDISNGDFSGFSINKIKDLMHQQAKNHRQQAATHLDSGETTQMLSEINKWMELVEDSSFEQIVEVDSPP